MEDTKSVLISAPKEMEELTMGKLMPLPTGCQCERHVSATFQDGIARAPIVDYAVMYLMDNPRSRKLGGREARPQTDYLS